MTAENDRKDLEAIVLDLGKDFYKGAAELSQFFEEVEEGLEMIGKFHSGMAAELEKAKTSQEPPYEVMDQVLDEGQLDQFLLYSRTLRSRRARFPSIWAELAVISLVARFEAFLNDLLVSILTTRPEMLRLRKQVEYKEIIGFSSIEEVVAALARKEIRDLTFSSFKKQTKEIQDRFGLAFTESGDSPDVLVEAFVRRNLLLHNAGRITDEYASEFPQMVDDETIRTDMSYWNNLRDACEMSVKYLCSSANLKFGLTQPATVRQ